MIKALHSCYSQKRSKKEGMSLINKDTDLVIRTLTINDTSLSFVIPNKDIFHMCFTAA